MQLLSIPFHQYFCLSHRTQMAYLMSMKAFADEDDSLQNSGYSLFIPFKEEERKREQEEQKRRENEMVFKAWLQKKKEQVQEEKRIRRAKELEDLNSKVRSSQCRTGIYRAPRKNRF